MTDTTTTDDDSTETQVEPAPRALEAGEPEQPRFWDRPYVNRYLAPLVLPVAAVFGIVFFVGNLSRLFLSAHGHAPIFIGIAVLLIILIGASVLSQNAGRLRGSTLIMITIGFVVCIGFAGWISIGHSENKEAGAATLPPTLKTTQTIKVEAAPGGNLVFTPKSLTAKTGLARIDVNFGATGHTFAFREPETLFKELEPTATGVDSGVAFFPKAGTYNFLCTIDGHAAAGMEGTFTVQGANMTLAEAEKAAGNP